MSFLLLVGENINSLAGPQNLASWSFSCHVLLLRHIAELGCSPKAPCRSAPLECYLYVSLACCAPFLAIQGLVQRPPSLGRFAQLPWPSFFSFLAFGSICYLCEMICLQVIPPSLDMMGLKALGWRERISFMASWLGQYLWWIRCPRLICVLWISSMVLGQEWVGTLKSQQMMN